MRFPRLSLSLALLPSPRSLSPTPSPSCPVSSPLLPSVPPVSLLCPPSLYPPPGLSLPVALSCTARPPSPPFLMPCSPSSLPVPPFPLCPAKERGSGCRRIKARGPEPGAARPLQESPHGAGGSRRIPRCRSDAPPDSAGAAAFPARRRERPPLGAAPCPPSVPLPLAAPGPGQRGWGGTSTLLGAAPPFLLQQNPFLRGWTRAKGLEEAPRCCPGRSDSLCAFLGAQGKGMKTRGSDALGAPRGPQEREPHCGAGAGGGRARGVTLGAVPRRDPKLPPNSQGRVGVQC